MLAISGDLQMACKFTAKPGVANDDGSQLGMQLIARANRINRPESDLLPYRDLNAAMNPTSRSINPDAGSSPHRGP